MSGKKGLMEQDLGKMDVTKLNPLSPEVISRQATINIGTIGNVAHGKSNKAISGVQVMTPFLGIPCMLPSKDEVMVAHFVDGFQLKDTHLRIINYDQALLFPAFKNQMNEGKGSLENPITMISRIPAGFFARVADLWTTYTKLKDEKSTPLDLDTVIHNDTKDKTISELKSDIAVLEELEHPIVEAMKQDLKLHEKNIILERISSGASASTSMGEGASSSRASRRH